MKASMKLLLALAMVLAVTSAAVLAQGEEASPDAASATAQEIDVEAPEDHSVSYTAPAVAAATTLMQTFQADDVFADGSVVKSGSANYANQPIAVQPPTLHSGIAGDKGLVATAPARHYGVVMPFDQELAVEDDTFVLQYEVRLQQGLECGGAYLKILSEATTDFSSLDNESPYVVMFGPDKCGATNKVHFILRHRNPVTDEYVEHFVKEPPLVKMDEYTHLYTLIIRADNSFEIKIDDATAKKGSLLEDMEPPVNPPEEIDDPEDEKPDNWVDEATMDDPDAVKPEDWDEDAPPTVPDMDASKPSGWLDDEPEYVADPEAEMPEDWDEEEDGEWEAPLVPNPACEEAPGCGQWVRPTKTNPEYKGKWSPPKIDNPDYIGVWAPRKIPNPAYFVDETPANLPTMVGAALEIWTMTGGLFFDNVLVTNDEAAASEFAQQTWKIKYDAQVAYDNRERARAARLAREQAYENGGLSGKINYFVLEGVELAKVYPIPAAATAAAIVGSLIFLCFRAGGGSSAAPSRPRSVYRRPVAEGGDGDDSKTGSDEEPQSDDEAEGEGDDDDDEDEGDAAPEEQAEEAEEDDANVVAPLEADDDSDDEDEGEGIPAPAATASPTVKKITKRRNRRKARISHD